MIREMDDADGCDCIQPPLTPFRRSFTTEALLSRLLPEMVALMSADVDDNLGNELEFSMLESITSLMAASVDVRRYRCRVSIIGCCAARWLLRFEFEGGADLWMTKDYNIFSFICFYLLNRNFCRQT